LPGCPWTKKVPPIWVEAGRQKSRR
jgi:hypothetical protein